MNVQVLDQDAAHSIRLGIALVQSGRPADLDAAIVHFDHAIDGRRRLVESGHPEFAFGLAAGWLNRGEALMAKGDAESRVAALAAADEAVRLLTALPWQIDAAIRRRLVVAWQHRGLALQRTGGSPAEATRCFEQAISLLADREGESIADRRTLAAAAWMNLAGISIDDSTGAVDRSRDAALAALALVDQGAAERDVVVAEIAIKSRYLICRALARELGHATGPIDVPRDRLELATDAVDEGLALARRWEQQGVEHFRELAIDLVRFGSRVYAQYQPQFLDEFVRENLDPTASSGPYVGDPGMRIARLEALWLSFRRPGPHDGY